MFWIAIGLRALAFFVEKRVVSYENMWPVSEIGDMVHKNKAYGTDGGVDEEGFDSSLKSDTAQQIIQQWIEVWSSDIKCQFSTTLWTVSFLFVA